MTYAPKTLSALMSFWTAQGGVNLGIVGNTSHTKGYHLGKDRIFDGSGPGIGWDDYSVKTARDKAGLTNAASAVDLGRLDGSLSKLWTFSMWLAKECMAGKADTQDVREVIFWDPKAGQVVGWSDLAPGRLIPGYGDASHKTHTHISYYRDSESRTKLPLFRRYPPFVVTPPTPEADVPTLSQPTPGYRAKLKATANVRSAPNLNGTLIRTVPAAGEVWQGVGASVGWVKGGVDPDGGSDQWLTRWYQNRWEYTAKSNVIEGPTAPVADCTAAVAQATKDGYAKGVADTKAKAKAVHTVTVVYE